MKQTTHLGALRSSLFVSRKGFTLIELLVTISILAALSVVAYATISGHIKTVNNATRISTIDSLALSLSDYYQTKKTLPEPNSNYIAYDDRGTYTHSLSGAYGVSGHASNDFLPAGYVNFTATDPESNQYYGYGKTMDPKTPTFNLAAALYDDTTGGYKAYVKGTYQNQKLASLIRSYSSSNFVSQDGVDDLPYNPYERKVTAYISSLSGSLTIKDSNGITIPLASSASTPFSYTGELSSGDTVIVATGSVALLHISDGSELSIGNPTSQTELELTSLVYNTDNNLSTKVKLFLKSGEIWTEAPHLRAENDSQSDFSIQTDSAVAAVRGTIFGMNRSATGITSISLVAGKLEVTRYTVSALTPFTVSDGFSMSATGGFVLAYDSGGSSAKSYMINQVGSTPIKLDNITNSYGSHASTGTITPSEASQKIFHPPFSFGYRPIADKITFANITGSTTTGTLTVLYNNPGADSYELYFGTGITDPNLVLHRPDLAHPSYTGVLTGTGPVTITGSFTYVPQSGKIWTYSLRVCLQGICSAPDVQHLAGNTFAYGPFHVWGDTTNTSQTSTEQTFTGQTVQQVTCPSNQLSALFWTSNCLGASSNTGLVAYAPYDNESDFGLYGSGGNSITTETGGTIGFASVGSVYGQSIAPSGYMRYTLPANLLGSSFMIEMRVRGSALKRTGAYYNLFWLSPNADGSNMNYTNLGASINSIAMLSIYNSCRDDGTCFPTSPISSIGLSGVNLDVNKFYIVRAYFGGSNSHVNISGDGIDISGAITTQPTTSNQYLFIGSKPNKTNQWHDIIDYVKIYKQ